MPYSFKFICFLILFVTACSNNSAYTNNDVNRRFDFYLKSIIVRFNLQERVVFDELYGFEKAKLEAQEYCQNLDKGKNKLQQLYKYSNFLQEKVDKNMISEEEKYAMKSVKLAIFSVAQLTYCLQNVNNQQIPLKERLGESS